VVTDEVSTAAEECHETVTRITSLCPESGPDAVGCVLDRVAARGRKVRVLALGCLRGRLPHLLECRLRLLEQSCSLLPARLVGLRDELERPVERLPYARGDRLAHT